MVISAQIQHRSVSSDVDELGAACIGKSAKIAGRLNALYNRILTTGMTEAENRILSGVEGGRGAVRAYDNANFEMANEVEAQAIQIDEVRITDGKQV